MKHWRWYQLPWVIALLVMCGLMWAERVSTPTGYPGAGSLIRPILGQVVMALGIVWISWIVPFLEPLEVPTRRSPRRFLLLKRWGFWFPPLLFAAWAAVILVLAGIDVAHARLTTNTLIVAILLIGILMASVPVSTAVSERFAERYRTFIRDQKHCFECGYDLRGNPDAPQCPECGTLSPLASETP